MCVSEKYQGMRVGQRLADFALDHLRSIGVELVTAHARESALPFYLKTGWQTVGNRYLEVGLPHFSVEKRIAGTASKKPAADLNCNFCKPTNRAPIRPLTRSPKRAAYD
jgi:predicted N-acetyltransferase YhbS